MLVFLLLFAFSPTVLLPAEAKSLPYEKNFVKEEDLHKQHYEPVDISKRTKFVVQIIMGNRDYTLKLELVNFDHRKNFLRFKNFVHMESSLEDKGDYLKYRQMEFLVYGSVDGHPDSTVYGSLYYGIFEGSVFTGSKWISVERVLHLLPFDEDAYDHHSVCFYDTDITSRSLTTDYVKREDTPSILPNYKESLHDFRKTVPLTFNPHCSIKMIIDHRITEMYEKKTLKEYQFITWLNDQKNIRSHFPNFNVEFRVFDHLNALLFTAIGVVNTVYKQKLSVEGHHITFYIGHLTIFNPSSCEGEKEKHTSPFCDLKRNATEEKKCVENNDKCISELKKFFNIVKGFNVSTDCLGVGLTALDQVVGQAWESNGLSFIGEDNGVCGTSTMIEVEYGKFETLSRNVVAANIQGKARAAFHHTLVHEFGHSLDARHDEGACLNQKYYLYETEPDILQDDRGFSSCSIEKMTEKLNSLVSRPPLFAHFHPKRGYVHRRVFGRLESGMCFQDRLPDQLSIEKKDDIQTEFTAGDEPIPPAPQRPTKDDRGFFEKVWDWAKKLF